MAVVFDRDHVLARAIIEEHLTEKGAPSFASEFVDDLEIRLEQVKIFYPLIDILRKRQVNEKSLEVVPELCFLLLTYLIYEGKLKYKGLSFDELYWFFSKGLGEIIPEIDDGRALLMEMLDAIQNGGRNFVLHTYSFINKGFREKYIKLVEVKLSEEGVLHYYVTEQGVDFYLKTKEFPDETKITINLLLFQKQMEKGAFGYAYETVRRLNMEVQKKRDRKETLLEALMYGAMDGGEAYERYHQSIRLQFAEEAKLFDTARKNVQDAFHEFAERISSGEAIRKEQGIFQLIKIIEGEIGRTQSLHTELLKEAANFTAEYDQVLKMRRKAIFTERFNFEHEFEKHVAKNYPPEGLKFLFEPLLQPGLKKSFNPLRVLEAQRVSFVREVEEEQGEAEVDEKRKTVDMVTEKRVRENFLFYAGELLLALQNGPLYLHDFCTHLVEAYGEDVVYNGDYIAFILEMNRGKDPGEHKKVIKLQAGQPDVEKLATIEDVLLVAAGTLGSNDISKVVVQSFPEEELEILPGLKMTKLLFVGEKKQ